MLGPASKCLKKCVISFESEVVSWGFWKNPRNKSLSPSDCLWGEAKSWRARKRGRQHGREGGWKWTSPRIWMDLVGTIWYDSIQLPCWSNSSSFLEYFVYRSTVLLGSLSWCWHILTICVNMNVQTSSGMIHSWIFDVLSFVSKVHTNHIHACIHILHACMRTCIHAHRHAHIIPSFLPLFIHWFIYSLIRSFTHSFLRLFIHSFIQSTHEVMCLTRWQGNDQWHRFSSLIFDGMPVNCEAKVLQKSSLASGSVDVGEGEGFWKKMGAGKNLKKIFALDL